MSNKTSKVLIVEDNEDILNLLGLVIGSGGYQVEKALNGLEGLNSLKENASQPPCVIILDLMMPIMDGWQFLEKIKGEDAIKTACSKIPIIISSAAEGLEALAKQYSCDYLQKPVRPADVLKKVKQHCSGATV